MLRRFSKRLAAFITDHITWEFLVALLARPWASGVTAVLAAAATVAGWAHKQPLYVTLPAEAVLGLAACALLISLSLKRERISEIRFDYLPERSPEQSGWKLVMSQGVNQPTFTLAGDPPDTEKCLYVRSNDHRIESYALDRGLELHESLCSAVEYSAKLADPDTSIVYAQVRMTSREGKGDKDGWIAHKFDTDASVRKEPYPEEWSVMVPGRPLPKSGWRSFMWSLPEEVERTFGTEGGWVYKRLLRIRLRGTLSITPIQLLE